MKKELVDKIDYLLNFVSTVSAYWSEKSNHYRLSEMMAEKKDSDIYAAAWTDLAQALHLVFEQDSGNLVDYIRLMKTFLEAPDYVPPIQELPLLYWFDAMKVFRQLKETKNSIDYELLRSMMLAIFSDILESHDLN